MMVVMIYLITSVFSLSGNNQIGFVLYALGGKARVDESEFDLTLEHLIKGDDIDFSLNSNQGFLCALVLLECNQKYYYSRG